MTVKQNNNNPHGLPAVLQVCDAQGGLRLCINEFFNCVKAGKAPKGYVVYPPSLFPADSYTRFVPEGSLNTKLYDLNGVLTKLDYLEIDDDILATLLLFLLDYGRRDSIMYAELNRVFNELDKPGYDDREHKDLTIKGLIDKAKQVYPADTRDVAQEAEERAQEADEIASLTVVERERKLNRAGFPSILDVKDPAGYSRPIVSSIFNRMRADEHIPGFVPNPYKQMHICRYLKEVPDYCLTGAYDLLTFWNALVHNKMIDDPKDVLFLVHASDWARLDNPCTQAVMKVHEKSFLNKPAMYIARQMEKHFDILAGGKANQQIVREMRHTYRP